MSVIFAVLCELFSLAFCWAWCPWCGQSFPFWGKAIYGPRKPWQCKGCGRMV